jgi:exodeoxyribonuclease V alpha subunit
MAIVGCSWRALIALHGGVKVYRGSAAAARHYVEADRGRADDYYLAEGTGIAERYVASPPDGVQREAPLTGDAYEAWVAGYDSDTGVAKGRLRNDDSAVRFVEVIVNGPKSWSLAAELHPDISAAYDAAQDAAARQIIGWLAEHATTRVGPRGAQVQVPVSQIDAVTVRHHTSRAGDPHRHLHLQINARALAEATWRGLHTIGIRDSIDAINGIGHAAVMTDPGFRAVLAAHGFTLDLDTGEVVQLADFVGPFSARAAQIGRNIDRYEAEWRAANPHEEPGPALRRAWDACAWADARPDKVVPHDGADLTRRWVSELRDLGYRDAAAPARVDPTRVGSLDRGEAVCEVLGRLAARRSAWNAADVRGEVEQLIARRNIVIDPSIRTELAEDLTVRTVAECVGLLERDGVPEHVRALTSRHVVAVESDITTCLTRRVERTAGRSAATVGTTDNRLDPTQREAVRALAGANQLVVIEGAAGAGKTTVLAETRRALELAGQRLVLVTPTRKAAQVAAHQAGTDAFSAAWLAHQHGFRWDASGRWTRLADGQIDPTTSVTFESSSDSVRLRRGDLLLVDEAGMLDQDTARALLTIADEHGARLALVGDRHQLPAVGRGGVLDLAARYVSAEAHRTLDTVHRFTRTSVTADGVGVTEPDDDYAALSLAMRTGDDPASVFDALLERGQVRVYGSDADRLAALADSAAESVASGSATVVVADTREQVSALNAAIRDRLVAAGVVCDQTVVGTAAGECLGIGDRVATRRNDNELRVANRDQWTVTAVHPDGRITVAGDRGDRDLPQDYVRAHVQLAYASTIHGAQGDTTTSANVVIGEHTSAPAAYVGMTRGREDNVAHVVAENVDDAREQWIAVFGRDRADLGPAHAAQLAAREADRYARQRPLDDVLDELRQAWTVRANAQARLADARERRDLLRDVVAIIERRDAVLPDLQRAYVGARATAESSAAQLRQLEPVIAAHANDLAATFKSEWDAQRQSAREAAQTVRHGTGRLGQRRAAVRQAREYIEHWAETWRLYLPAVPIALDQVVSFAAWFDDTPRHHEALDVYARTAAEQAHPDYLAARETAQDASEAKTSVWYELRDAQQHYSMALQHYGALGSVDDPAARLATVGRSIASDEAVLAGANDRINALRAEPTLRAQPPEVVDLARVQWAIERDHRAAWQAARPNDDHDQGRSAQPHDRGWGSVPEISLRGRGQGISR